MRFWSQYSLYSSGNLKQLWLIICLFYCWVVDKSYSCTWWWFLQYGKKIQRSEYHKSAFVVYVFSWKVSVLNYKHPFNTICLSAALIRDLPSLLAKSAITQLVMGFKLSSSAKQENQKRFREQTQCHQYYIVQDGFMYSGKVYLPPCLVKYFMFFTIADAIWGLSSTANASGFSISTSGSRKQHNINYVNPDSLQ